MSIADHLTLASDLRTQITLLVKKLRKLAPVDGMLSQSERSVLVLLERHEKLLSSELALMEKITAQSMGQILHHLSTLGFINKKLSSEDKRKVIISLSPKGNTMLKKVRSERDAWLTEAITKTCSVREQAMLKNALKPLKKIIDF